MIRRYEKLFSPAIGREIEVLVFGHFGHPIIAFPSGGGKYHDFEDNGMIGVTAPWIEAGKVKIYCPDGVDNEAWLNKGAHLEHRAGFYRAYEDFILNTLVPGIRFDCKDPGIRIGLAGCSLGATHAANFALKRPDIFHWALCMSGRYEISDFFGGWSNDDVYFNNPLGYPVHFGGEHLDWVRRHAHLTLVCGQGAWEDKCLRDTHRLGDVLASKGISHERDIWGHDVEHHWHWWRKQIVHHFGKALGNP